MKKSILILISAVILFSLINIGLAQASIFTERVLYNDYCPAEGATIYVRNASTEITIGICLSANETGYCQTTMNLKPDTWYKSNTSINSNMCLWKTDEYGNGGCPDSVRSKTLNYPNGTLNCGDTECDGLKYCLGNPQYIECRHSDQTPIWNYDCDTKKCCLCSANNKANPTQNYDSSQNQDCPFCQQCSALNTCSNASSGTDPKNDCTGNCDNCNGLGSCASFDSLCTGNCDYCNNGNCAANDTICQALKCASCNGGGNSFSCAYNSTQNEDCSATSCPYSCNIDSNPFTWDYANDASNYCFAFDTCTNNQCNYQHACADADIYDGVFSWESIIRGCTAECDQNSDCQNKCVGNVRYHSGSCLGSCTCSYSTENCDNQDGCYAYDTGCEDRNYYCTPGNCDYTYSNRNTDYDDAFINYCSADTIRKHRTLHDFYCSGTCSDHTSWVDDQLIQDCNLQDGWYNTTNTQWISSGECTEKEQKQQEYRDYTCSAAACTYSVTNTRWIDTGNTRNKPSGTWCGSARDCPNNACIGSFAYFYPADGHDACNSAGTCVAYSCASTNHYCTDNDHLDGINTLECGAQCDQNSDCSTGVCTSSCTCASDSTPPTITILSPQNNTTYKSGTIQLTFTLSEPATWCVYSLDGSANKTIWSCSIMTYMTMFSITPAPHNIVVYAKDASGNVGVSNKVYFTANYSFGGGGSGCGFRSCLRM